MARWSAPAWNPRPPRARTGAASRSSTCARCPRSIWTRSPPRYARPAAASSRTRRRCTPGSAPRSPPGSPSGASTTSRRRCCASAASPLPTRRPGSRSTTCPTWTGSWTPSTARSVSERGAIMAELKEFKLPDVGEGLTEADIVAWHVKPGDQVEDGQIIVEIETAKAVVELPSPWDGIVARLLAEEGQTVDVGTPIIAIDVGDAEAGVPTVPAVATTAKTDDSERTVVSPPSAADQPPGAAPERQAVL